MCEKQTKTVENMLRLLDVTFTKKLPLIIPLDLDFDLTVLGGAEHVRDQNKPPTAKAFLRAGKKNVSNFYFVLNTTRYISRVSLLILHTQTESGAEFLPISAAASIYLFKPPSAIESVPGLLSHATAYRWRSLPRVRRHRTSSPQGSSSNECCLCMTMDHGPSNVRLSFPTPTIGMKYEVVILIVIAC